MVAADPAEVAGLAVVGLCRQAAQQAGRQQQANNEPASGKTDAVVVRRKWQNLLSGWLSCYHLHKSKGGRSNKRAQKCEFYCKPEGIAAVQLQEDMLDGRVDKRKVALDSWVSEQLGHEVVGETASADASFRRYFRYSDANRTLIGMDAPPEQEDCRPFVQIAGTLEQAGLHVPHILASDYTRGFLLLSDLGRSTWLPQLDEADANNKATAFFADAIEALITLQQASVADLPRYDQALIERELALFPDWYLAKERKLDFTPTQQKDWQALCSVLTDNMLAQSQVFVHRDYMPRNLMVSEPNPGVIDFQDAVAGPIGYDPVCLFRDAFLSWPEDKITDWLRQYYDKGIAAGLPLPAQFNEFKRQADLTGVQRHLKVIGIFARICHRDGKPKYLQDVPRFFRYLRTQAAAYDELAPLARLLADVALTD